jgi:hypothetical protein
MVRVGEAKELRALPRDRSRRRVEHELPFQWQIVEGPGAFHFEPILAFDLQRVTWPCRPRPSEFAAGTDDPAGERQPTFDHELHTNGERHQLDPLSSGLSRAWSWPLVATVTLQSFSWTTFGHASQNAPSQGADALAEPFCQLAAGLVRQANRRDGQLQFRAADDLR